MPNSNPAAGKQSAETHYKSHDRTVNGKTVRVRSHTRTAQITRSKTAWIALGFSTISAIAIILEAFVTTAASIAFLIVAAAGTIAVIVKPLIEENRKKLNTPTKQQAQRKRPSSTRTTGTRRTTRRR